jgi:hypothetical protein
MSRNEADRIVLNVNGWDHEGLAKRLSGIIAMGEPIYLVPEEKWQLDPGNNWWLRIAGDTATITTRYPGAFTLEQWSALVTVIDMFICPRRRIPLDA